jgi:hypothetical protein
MAMYTAKLVDHTDSRSLLKFKGGIQRIAQELYDKAFEGTSDSVTVSWGTGTQSDNLVIHFVLDRAHSYIWKTWPDARIDPDAGGHTHTEGALACTEIYENVGGHRQHVRQLGVLIFHESLHNLLPFWGMEELHNLDGGGAAAGLAARKIGPDATMTEKNKELIRRGFSVKNPQYL